jgi:S-adenosylmethionine:tRNA ribosyltransferase-isomerase
MSSDFKLSSYDYELPPERIAQEPSEQREKSRLLVVHRTSEQLEHLHFADITKFLGPDDLLVVNNTKVFPARLLGRKESGGKIEFFLLEYPILPDDGPATNQIAIHKHATVLGLIKSSRPAKVGSSLLFGENLSGVVEEILGGGKIRVRLQFILPDHNTEPSDILSLYGEPPLPPYIKREKGLHNQDRERYQTVFANHTGAVAAPTAGLHFSETLLQQLRQKITVTEITLHVGYGTFAPVRTEDIRHHSIHREFVIVSEQTARLINDTKKKNGRIWAVGTTTVRSLEFAADEQGVVSPFTGECDLYIYPGYRFRVIDNLITNFHLPKSSLLFLVSAMIGRRKLLDIYQTAIDNEYRFYSYGDAMMIVD